MNVVRRVMVVIEHGNEHAHYKADVLVMIVRLVFAILKLVKPNCPMYHFLILSTVLQDQRVAMHHVLIPILIVALKWLYQIVKWIW